MPVPTYCYKLLRFTVVYSRTEAARTLELTEEPMTKQASQNTSQARHMLLDARPHRRSRLLFTPDVMSNPDESEGGI
jgi:hypothetical protein